MKTILSLLALTFATLGAAQAVPANPVLDASVAVSEALASDDLASAKKAASTLAEAATDANQQKVAGAATEITTSQTLEAAREHFKAVSEVTVTLATGQDRYYVMNCPMAGADWVQKTPKVRNPYMGKSMLECGSLKESQ